MSKRERWLPVPGWEGLYEVSDWGQVRSLGRVILCSNGHTRLHYGRVLQFKPHTQGYHAVGLCRDGLVVPQLVHWLVMAAFVGPRPPGLDICHWDGDPQNNHLSNLRYDTRSGNVTDTFRHGRFVTQRDPRTGRWATAA